MTYVLRATCTILVALACFSGCKSTPDTPPLRPVVSESVPLEFEQAWQKTRDFFLDKKYEIYTRDKRGLFVVRTPMHRRLLFFPQRTQHTIRLEALGSQETRVTVETIHQSYRVTLLTFPDWRDTPHKDDLTKAESLLAELVAHTVAEPQGTTGPSAG